MRFAVLCFLASGVLPSASRAQAPGGVPVIEITKEDSSIKFRAMAFDRKDYGMNKGIPLVKIADRVEVTVDLKGKRVSGPPLVFKQ